MAFRLWRSFELALQGAQRQTVMAAKLILAQSTRFQFTIILPKMRTADQLIDSRTPRTEYSFQENLHTGKWWPSRHGSQTAVNVTGH